MCVSLSPFSKFARRIVAIGVLLGACKPTEPPPPVALVTVTPAAATLVVGGTQQLSATLTDANSSILSERTIAWNTSDPTTATVSQSGLVTAVALGTATVAATSGGKTGISTITVAAPPVASVTISPGSSSLAVGGTTTLTATARDANGNVLTGETWSWASTNLNIVSGTFVGNVLTATGVGVGSATITATAGGKSGSAVFTVTAGIAPLSAPGQSAAFLNSPNFAATLTMQPGAQYLIAVVNTDPSFTSREDFTLSTSFGAASTRGIAPHTVAPVMKAPAGVAPQLGVGLPRESPGLNAFPLMRSLAQNHVDALQDNRRIFARYGNPTDAWEAARSQRGLTAQVGPSISQTIGTVNKVYVRTALGGSCNAVDSIGARTVAVGQHVIVLADTNRTTWPQGFRPDTTFYQTFANEYDQITYPHLLNFIGNPLAYDASLSGIGKVTVTITPVLNNLAGVPGGGTYVAFVSGCDFFPFVGSAANPVYSNQTEMFYSFVPSATGFSVASWEAELRATAAHESKHIVSYADRILLGSAGSDEVWLEEGLAQVSTEVWERHFNQATWKGHATFVQTVTCEIDLAPSYPCDATGTQPFALMFNHLPFFFTYLERESTSNSEGLDADGQANYGGGWAFARWTIDQYASSGEGPFIKSLINTTTTGLTTLSTITGQPVPLLLTYWNVASGVFQTPAYTAADVRTTIPSFNFADIFLIGQTNLPPYTGWTCGGKPCGLFTNPNPPPPIFPIQPIPVAAGSFSRTVSSVPGTSASFFLLSGTAVGTETLSLLNGSGGPLSASSGFRVLILRVQ
jgi:Bacterial Ig-like domain (group 2)